jgi:hypothetical protein
MSQTIRIDDEVWAWLKGMAQPLEDTPNSVLRRVAGLNQVKTQKADPEKERGGRIMLTTSGSRSARITGEALNLKFKLGAKHALYHKDGTFYEQLRDFPGILCDDGGYVMYASQAQFERDSQLNIGQKVNIYRGLAHHPQYRPFPEI